MTTWTEVSAAEAIEAYFSDDDYVAIGYVQETWPIIADVSTTWSEQSSASTTWA